MKNMLAAEVLAHAKARKATHQQEAKIYILGRREARKMRQEVRHKLGAAALTQRHIEAQAKALTTIIPEEGVS